MTYSIIPPYPSFAWRDESPILLRCPKTPLLQPRTTLSDHIISIGRQSTISQLRPVAELGAVPSKPFYTCSKHSHNPPQKKGRLGISPRHPVDHFDKVLLFTCFLLDPAQTMDVRINIRCLRPNYRLIISWLLMRWVFNHLLSGCPSARQSLVALSRCLHDEALGCRV